LEEARYRSPTWALLRALQQINSATKIEGEVATPAPSFFQSAGRGDLLFCGEKKEPTVVIWEGLSKQEKEIGWKMQARCTTGSCGASQKKVTEEIRSFELSRKEIFSNYDETRLKKEKNEKNWSKKNWSKKEMGR